MRRLLFIFWLCSPVVALSQEAPGLWRTKTVKTRDSIQLNTVSINPYGFQVFNQKRQRIPQTAYRIDFAHGFLYPKDSLRNTTDSLVVRYRHYPTFLTKKYYQFNPNRIVHNVHDKFGLYRLGRPKTQKQFKPFNGLNTSGSISRGITAGTNQNSVLNSELNLQITGNIAENVQIRASIQDDDIPLQQSGYSQNLNEFDQVFIEIAGKHWKVRGGDVNLQQEGSYFGNFHKKVQGLSVQATLNHKGNSTDVFAAGAVVRGVFTRNTFHGQEGNQGPYKLHGPNGELFALIVSGSERVYVNGMRLERGENKDYVIDYNAGEIRFNPTFPITSNMRITVEFQYADRNYSRIVVTGGAEHHGKNWEIGGFVYSENDLRNQPLQQTLSNTQKQILADAGDRDSLMFSPSAVSAKFSPNQVLYTKDTVNGRVIYVYSKDPEAELYRVKFSLVGPHNGHYILSNATAITKIYEYVPPVNGVPQGKYAPITRLYAPTKLQMAVINGRYHPSDKTHIAFELAGSSHDQNLFSGIDDSNNKGYAAHFEVAQTLLTTANRAHVKAFAKVDFIEQNFESIEPLYHVEFNRNWNLVMPTGNRTYLNAGVEYTQPQHGFIRYNFQKLDYSNNYSGTRQVLNAQLQFGDFSTNLNSSYLNSNGQLFSSAFLSVHAQAIYRYEPFWTGVRFDAEDNRRRDRLTDSLTGISQKFNSYEIFTGLGDKSGIYAEIGYKHRVTDSLRLGQLQRVNASDNYYLKSQLLNSAQAQLSVYINYRKQKNQNALQTAETSLNSRILYHQFLFNRVLSLNTTYQTSSGNLPQQEYTYVKVDPGRGRYTWNDYNSDGVQDLGEFEIAPYPDQAEYVRVLLPNRIYVKTRRNKLSQTVTLNFQQLRQNSENDSWLAHFYNQTAYLVDRRVKRDGQNFNLNPFRSDGEELAVNLNFRNTLYFNRGKQHYTTAYTFISAKSKTLFSTGRQASSLKSHQLRFNHKIGHSWLIGYETQLNRSTSHAESFSNRDFALKGFQINPSVSFFLNPNTRFKVFYRYNNRQNTIGQKEALKQHKLGVTFNFSNAQHYALRGDFNYIYNNFSGDAFSPVAYEMLQGLQPEQNFTWRVFFQKKITDYLDLNLTYSGRKSMGAPTIHTGSVQLKAYF